MQHKVNDELYHFGIKGQKWGERNYQNQDGTYTEEGKARRRKSDGYSDDYKRKKELLKRDPRTLSNKEMQEINNRIQLEKQYDQNIYAGRNVARKVLDKVGEKTAEAIAVALVAAGTAYVTKKIKGGK